MNSLFRIYIRYTYARSFQLLKFGVGIILNYLCVY